MNQFCSSPKFVARASAAVRKTCSTINRTIAPLVLSACAVAAAAQSDSPAFAKFKSEMMPKVGEKITVVGTWNDEMKQCCWLEFNNWGAYIYTAKASSHPKEDDMSAHFRNGQKLKVTGTLRYFPGRAGSRKQVRAVQIPPEHFFIEAAEVEMVPPTQN